MPPRNTVLVRVAVVVAAVIVAVALAIAFFDWNSLRGPLARAISARIERPISIGGLQAALITPHPRVRVIRLTIGNPDWAGGGQMVSIDRLDVQVQWLPLLRGELVLPRVVVSHPEVKLFRGTDGRANWVFGNGRASPKQKNEPTRLPLVRRLLIESGKLNAEDQIRKLTFDGTLAASAASGHQNTAFQLKGKGELNRKPFELTVTGGPLIWVESHKPYPFDVQIRASDIRARARGVLPKPLDLGNLDVTLSVSGNDLADGYYLTGIALPYYLTGIALPNTPPYSMSGHLKRTGMTFEMSDLQGTLGGSDIHGRATLKVATGNPIVNAELESRSLNLADAGPAFGGSAPTAAEEAHAATATGHPEKGAAQHAITTAVRQGVTPGAAKTASQDRYLMPTARLQVDRLRGMDATVHYRAQEVKAQSLPLRAVDAQVRLKDSVLHVDPFAVTLPEGRLTGTAVINASGQVPAEDVDVRLTNVKLDQFHLEGASTPPLQGTLVGRLKMHGSGDSVHAFASSANGMLSMVVPHAEIEQSMAELTGINVVHALGLMATKDDKQTPVRCGIAEFESHDGVAVVKQVVFDTKVVLLTGSGDINLHDEKIDVALHGQPKKFRIGVLHTPVLIGGTLRHPAIGVKPGKLAAQGGVAAALGTLATPLAAIAAFVDPGLNKSADCQALLQEAKSMGTPVRTAAARSGQDSTGSAR
jgi:uncharacterized protein involved in outer membrane biogenesis